MRNRLVKNQGVNCAAICKRLIVSVDKRVSNVCKCKLPQIPYRCFAPGFHWKLPSPRLPGPQMTIFGAATDLPCILISEYDMAYTEPEVPRGPTVYIRSWV